MNYYFDNTQLVKQIFELFATFHAMVNIILSNTLCTFKIHQFLDLSFFYKSKNHDPTLMDETLLYKYKDHNLDFLWGSETM